MLYTSNIKTVCLIVCKQKLNNSNNAKMTYNTLTDIKLFFQQIDTDLAVHRVAFFQKLFC